MIVMTMTPHEPTAAERAGTAATLTALDTCDRCGAQAFVRLTLDGHTIDFCAHHFAEHDLALHVKGWVITADDRQSLS
jgi:hypothetical protein